MSTLTAQAVIDLEFNSDITGDEVPFECNACKAEISSYELVGPCHPQGWIEGSGHGGNYDIYCIVSDDNCGWGGPVEEFFPQLLCPKCGQSPFVD